MKTPYDVIAEIVENADVEDAWLSHGWIKSRLDGSSFVILFFAYTCTLMFKFIPLLCKSLK